MPRLVRTVGVGACGICPGRLDRHGRCGPHLNVDVFGAVPSTNQQCDLETMSATSRWRLPLSSIELHTCWRPHVIGQQVWRTSGDFNLESAGQQCVCILPRHDMHVCVPRTPFGPSVPHPLSSPTWCVSTGLCCLGSAMAWVSDCPYFRPGHVPPSGQWVALPVGLGCPALLHHLLAVNHLVVDESTNRDGNCGISACAISLLALLKGGQCKKGTSTEVRRLQSLRRCPPGQQVTQARVVAVSGLTHDVTGEDFPSYVQRTQRNGDWLDTAFLHALACAFGSPY